MSETMNKEDIERLNVRLISPACFSFKSKDLLDIRGVSGFDYEAFL